MVTLYPSQLPNKWWLYYTASIEFEDGMALMPYWVFFPLGSTLDFLHDSNN